jgi:hypothetical protein
MGPQVASQPPRWPKVVTLAPFGLFSDGVVVCVGGGRRDLGLSLLSIVGVLGTDEVGLADRCVQT